MRTSGYRLAITGGIKETAFELPDIASYACEYLLEAYPDLIKERFKYLSYRRPILNF
jgi:ribosome biogenesis GTPase A